MAAIRDMSRNARNGEFGNFDEFRRRAIELEIGVPTKGDFDKSGEFCKNSDFDEFRRRPIELEMGIQTKRRF